MTLQLDPRFTFETFAVGSRNRMAAAAARRVAESPGASVNPLFVHGASAVGKTHLLHATVALARAVRPDLVVIAETADTLADRISAAVGSGGVQGFRDALTDAQLVVIDDIQHLAGKGRSQEELLAVWDDLLHAGVQLMITGDAAPAEMEGFSEPLRQRLASGLAVDLSPPDAEARLQVVRREAGARGLTLAPGVERAIAALPVAGLYDGVARVAEIQAERGGPLPAEEVAQVLGTGASPAAGDEFHAWLSDIATTVEQLVEEAPWRRRLAEAILRFEGEGVRTRRLEAALDTDTAPDVDMVLETFAADVERLRTLSQPLLALDPAAARNPAVNDPDRIEEVEALLKAARVSAASSEAAPAGPTVDRWFYTNVEKVAWQWVGLDDRMLEELG